MSYARWSPGVSDVYVYGDAEGQLVCHDCRLLNFEGDKRCETREGMILHLKEHREAGHRVPESTFSRLRDEAAGTAGGVK
jgi:hypothetical protein